MNLRKAWISFLVYSLIIFAVLSMVFLAVFYNSSRSHGSDRTAIFEEFVRNQKFDLIKNVVNNLVAEISMQKAYAENAGISDVQGYVLRAMQDFADSYVPLGDIEIRIDALNNYDGYGDFATRIITPYFQRTASDRINASNADYFNVLDLIVQNGVALTGFDLEDGTIGRFIYARLYRSYDWVVSASVSAEDIQQLTNMLSEEFEEEQRRFIYILVVTFSVFGVVILTSFIFIGRLLYINANKKLKYLDDLSNLDGLTKIYNRRYLDSTLRSIVSSMSRTDAQLSVLLIDIDYFKLYNDTYGHHKGDVTLQKIAQALSDNLPRESDFVARYGGEEFAAILPGTDETGVHTVASKLLECVRDLKIPHKESLVSPYVTISIGAVTGKAASFEKHDWKLYLNRADEALYMSKHGGRNMYTCISFKKKPAQKLPIEGKSVVETEAGA